MKMNKKKWNKNIDGTLVSIEETVSGDVRN